MIENFRQDTVKIYAEKFFDGKEETALKNIRVLNPITIFKDKIIIFQIFLIICIFISYFMLTYIKGIK